VKRLVGFVVYNWPLKLLALALAFLLYAGLVVSQSTFEFPSPVRIDILNQPTGAVVLGNLPAVTRIRYYIAGDVGATPTQESFRATIDLKDVDPKSGSTYAAVSVSSVDPRFVVIDYEPRGINVQLDPYSTYTVPVRVNTGTTPENLEVGDPVLSQKQVSVSGPDSVVKFVVAAQADVVVDPHGLFVDRDVPLIAVDNLGNQRSPVRVDPPTVHVKIPVFSNAQTKSLVVNPLVVGTPPVGYAITSIVADPVSVSVKGDPANLAGLVKADTQAIAVGAATSTIDTEVPLALPSGVLPLDASNVHVRVTIVAETGTRAFAAGVVLTGRQPGLAYTVAPLNAIVTLGGPVADLDRIEAAGFVLPIDVATLGLGTHSVEPAPTLQAGLRLLAISPATITVTIGAPGASPPPPAGSGSSPQPSTP
jgi:YbbR domain-containing protein